MKADIQILINERDMVCFLSAGAKAHHRPVRGPAGRSQPHLTVRSAVWSRSGEETHTRLHTHALTVYNVLIMHLLSAHQASVLVQACSCC